MKLNQNNQTTRSHLTTPHLLQLFLLAMLLSLFWAGCKSNGDAASDVDPVGSYTLVSVDGNKVPCPINHDGTTLNVKSGAFVINADGTCSSRIAFSRPGGESSREVKATYTRDGSKLTMRWQGAGTTIGEAKGNTFTMNNEGMVFAYSK